MGFLAELRGAPLLDSTDFMLRYLVLRPGPGVSSLPSPKSQTFVM